MAGCPARSAISQLGVSEFAATANGFKQVHQWLESFGEIECIGIEGTGSYGAGLASDLSVAGIRVAESSCTNRQLRRRKGKSNPVDAESAARTALAGQALGTPKSQDGPIEAMRLVRVERRSAIKARTQAANQLRGTSASAPEPVRRRFRGRTVEAVVKTASTFRISDPQESLESTHRSINAVAESFFSSLKKERIRKKVYRTRDLAKADVFEHIEMSYNRTRRHSYLGGASRGRKTSPSNTRPERAPWMPPAKPGGGCHPPP